MNIRIEDLTPILQSQINSGLLLYVSNSGTPYSMNLNTFGSGISGVISPLIVYTTGTQQIGGVKSFTNIIPDTSNNSSIDVNNRQLYNSNGFIVVDWHMGSLTDVFNKPSIDWTNRGLTDSTIGSFSSLGWGARMAYGTGGLNSIDWGNRLLYNNAQIISLDWNNRILTGNWNLNGNYILTNIDSGNIVNASSNNTEGFKLLRTPKINFGLTGVNTIYTVPVGYLFNIDTMEIITTDIIGATGPTGAPWTEFGFSGNISGYNTLYRTFSNSLNARDIINNPQDAVTGGVVLTATIYSGSRALSHSGFLLYKGYLIKNS